jgi:hypothetical protein
VANDVPHALCEALTPARVPAARGYRVLVFDYRDRGLSEASDAPGRLDQDVAGAVPELRSPSSGRTGPESAGAGVDEDCDRCCGFLPSRRRMMGRSTPQGDIRANTRRQERRLFLVSGRDEERPNTHPRDGDR